MSDDLIRSEATRIDLNENREVRYWAHRFNVTEEALRDAVLQTVAQYLDDSQ